MAVTVPGSWAVRSNSRCGPFDHNGNLYLVLRTVGNVGNLSVLKSTDGGATWSTLTTAFISTGNTIQAVDVVREGDFLHVAIARDDGVIQVRPWNMATDQAGDITPVLAGGAWFAMSPVFLARRSNGDYVVFHQNESTARIMGSDYLRIAYSIWNGSSWTTIVPGFQSGLQNSQFIQYAFGDVNDAVHFVVRGLNVNVQSYSLSPTNTVSNAGSPNDDGAAPGQLYPVGVPGYNGAATSWLLTTHGTSAYRLMLGTITNHVVSWDSADPTTNMVPHQLVLSQPPGVVTVADGVAYAFYVREDTRDIMVTNDQGTNDWTVPPEAFATSNTQGISAGLLPSMNAIGVLFNDGGTVKFDTLALAASEPITQAPTLSLGTVQADSIGLSWTAAEHAQEYEIYRNGSLLTTVSDTSHTDNTVSQNTSYNYHVRGVNPDSNGPNSNTINITTPYAAITQAPTLSLGTVQPDSVALSWTSTDNAIQYEIRRNGALVNTTASLSWTDETVSPESSYDYDVRGINPDFNGPYSNVVTANTPAPVAFAPILLSPPDGATSNATEFTWEFQSQHAEAVQDAFAFRTITGEYLPRATPGLPGTGNDVAFSPDGAYLVAAHNRLTVVDTSTWDVVSGTPTLPSNGNGVSFSPDGAYLAVAHNFGDGLMVIDASTWGIVSGIPVLPSHGRGVAFSPDGAYLAVAHVGGDGLTVVDTSTWDVVSGTPTLPNTGQGVAFSSDGTRLVAAHDSGNGLTVVDTSTWDVVSGTPTLPGNGNGVSFSPDGAYLAVAHLNSPRLTVVDTSTWDVVSGTPALPSNGNGVSFSPDGTRLAVAHANGSRLTVVDTSTWDVVSGTPTLPGNGNGVAFSSDGAYLAAAHVNSPHLIVVDTFTWDALPVALWVTGNGREVAFSPDGAYLAVAHLNVPRLTVVDTSTWDVVSGTPALPSNGNGVSFSSDGTRLAVAHANGSRLTVIDVSTWDVVSGTPTLPGNGNGVAFSPDGAYLAAAHIGGDGLTVVDTSTWDVVSGTPVLSSTGNDVAFSPDGAYLAAAHNRLTVVDTSTWDVVSGTSTLANNGNGVSFSPDGAYLAVAHNFGDGLTVIDVSTWDIVSGTPVLPSHGMGVAFSSGGAYLAVTHVGGDGLTVIDVSTWDVVSGTPTLPGTGQGVAFSSDGTRLVAAHDDGGGVTSAVRLIRWWNGSQWSDTETLIESASELLTLPAGAWTDE